jgi:hypothetical protein
MAPTGGPHESSGAGLTAPMLESARGPDGQPLPDVCYQWTFWGMTKAMQCHPAPAGKGDTKGAPR